MAYNREFIVDKIFVINEYYGWIKPVVSVEAYWKITNTEYPKGVAKYDLSKDLPLNLLDRETWVDIDAVTNTHLENWLTAEMTTQDKIDIELNSQSELIRTNTMDSWVVHYDRFA